MQNQTYISKLIKYVIIASLIFSMAIFFGVKFKNNVKAEETSTQYSVVFYAEHFGFENITVTVQAGGSVELPSTPAAEGVYEYVWSVSESDLQNITENKTINLIRRVNPSLMHTVTFTFPDGSVKTVQVLHGEDIIDPPTSDNLSFGEKNTYSVSLKNINSDMNVTVGTDKTLKYVIIAICGAAIITGLAVMIVVVLKMLNKPDENEEKEINILNENDKE